MALAHEGEWTSWNYRVLQRDSVIRPRSVIEWMEALRDLADDLEAAHADGPESLDDAVLGTDQIGVVARLIETVEKVYHEAPQVMGWCVWTKYRDQEGAFAGREIIWSAHTTRAQAQRFLPYWVKKHAHRTDYEWQEVALKPAKAGDFIHPEVKPGDIPWKWRA